MKHRIVSVAVLMSWLLVAIVNCQNGLNEREKMEILTAHNLVRGKVNPPAANMAEMVWSEELAQNAQIHADKCAWEHSARDFRGTAEFSWVGENLLATTGPARYGRHVESWYNESKNYDYSTKSCSNVCGHYTQVVWAESTELGCGARRCSNPSGLPSNALILVCHYGPGGNFNNEDPYVRGLPCSACPADHICKGNLCSAKDEPILPTVKPRPVSAQPSPVSPSTSAPSPLVPSTKPSPAQPSPTEPSPTQPSPAQPSTAEQSPTPNRPSPVESSSSSPSPAYPSTSPSSPPQSTPTTSMSPMMRRILFMIRFRSESMQQKLRILRVLGLLSK